jgi:hypothetical protein
MVALEAPSSSLIEITDPRLFRRPGTCRPLAARASALNHDQIAGHDFTGAECATAPNGQCGFPSLIAL